MNPKPVPWPATVMTLIAFAAFIANRRQVVLPALLAAAVVAAMAVPRRIRGGSPQAWLLRLGLYAAVLLTVLSEPPPMLDNVSYAGHYLDAITQLCMAEIALQYWLWPRWGGSSPAAAVLLSGFIVVAAAKTYDRQRIPYFAPAYLIFLVLTLRSIPARAESALRSWRARFAMPVALAVLIVLLMGLAGSTVIRANRRALTGVGMDLPTALGAASRTIGFSDAPVLGARQNVARSLTRVLRIERISKDDTGSQQQTAAARATHLRGVTFETYNHGRWEPPLNLRRFSLVASPPVAANTGETTLRITRLIDDVLLLPLPLHSAEVGLPEQQRGASGELQREDEHGRMMLPVGPGFAPFAYQVRLNGEEHCQGPLCAPLTERERARCLAVPDEIDPRVRELALRIGGQLANPRERIAAVENYLRSQFAYSLTMDPGEGDPLSNFLLEKKPAHCEYFASGAAILMRCLDIPSRYVTGFYAHESSGPDSSVVRQQDAHAWAECWLEGTGWVTVEATPAAGWPEQLGERPSFWRRSWEWLSDLPGKLGAQGWSAAAVALGAGVAIWAVFYWRRLRRAREQSRAQEQAAQAYTSPGPVLDQTAKRFDELLARRRIPCPAHLTWTEHLAIVAPLLPQGVAGEVPRLSAFLERYNSVRFGLPGDSAAVAGLGREMEEVMRET